MPDQSGFANAPATRTLLFSLLAASLVVALADGKDLFDLRVGGFFSSSSLYSGLSAGYEGGRGRAKGDGGGGEGEMRGGEDGVDGFGYGAAGGAGEYSVMGGLGLAGWVWWVVRLGVWQVCLCCYSVLSWLVVYGSILSCGFDSGFDFCFGFVWYPGLVAVGVVVFVCVRCDNCHD